MSTHTQEQVPVLTLGWRLKMALGKGSADAMADHLGVSRQTVSRWMNDNGAPPKRAYIIQWAMATGTDAEWLESGKVTGAGGGDEGQGTVRHQGLEPRTRCYEALAA